MVSWGTLLQAYLRAEGRSTGHDVLHPEPVGSESGVAFDQDCGVGGAYSSLYMLGMGIGARD